MKILKIILIPIIFMSPYCFAEEKLHESENMICIKNNLANSLGSVFYENNKKYICSIVYGKNMIKEAAWVELKIGAAVGDNNIIIYK